jgi:hypothetical protein
MKALYLALTVSLYPGLAASGALEDSMKTFVENELRATIADPMLIAAIKSANVASMSLTPNDILVLDGQWKAEVGTDSALIKGVADSPTSSALREFVEASEGKITEVILMDAQGLNVAVSDVTSDYWQGDEDKHRLTYSVGPTAFHVSEVEFDESTQTYQAQVSFTVVDPATVLIHAAGWRYLHGKTTCNRPIVFQDGTRSS